MSFNCYPLSESLKITYGYCSFRYKHRIFVYGGCDEDSTDEYFKPPDIIHDLNLFTGIWTEHVIKENLALPNRRVYSLMVPHNDTAYLFCGFDSIEYRICDFRGLDLNTFEFKMLSKPPVSERDKLEGWTYQNDIYFFGGYGPMPVNKDQSNSHSTHKPYQEYYNFGWNNDLVAYNTKTKSWFHPSIKGPLPSGRAAYGLVQFGHRIYFVCGRRMERRCSEIHILDLHEGEWSGEIQISGKSPVPEGRSWMACCPVGDQYIYVQGGISNQDKALSDIWLFNINTHTWSEILTQQVLAPRLACRGHSGLNDNYVIVISGRREDITVQVSDEACNKDYLVWELAPRSLKLLSLRTLYHMLNKGSIQWTFLEKVLPLYLQTEYLELIK
ncbi:hypothetical protein LOD99_7674 [Oopsacas minuta]|uniref:Kelch domain-containing protein 10 n=1 Tax=Oopsacas minuta TaxID=111878 RepID=A0AAV7JP89_9METZ|nr:hypothetical protein LOD99_7674 [Oopsacas minuta]